MSGERRLESARWFSKHKTKKLQTAEFTLQLKPVRGTTESPFASGEIAVCTCPVEAVLETNLPNATGADCRYPGLPPLVRCKALTARAF